MNVTVIINSSKETTRIGMEQGMAARKTESKYRRIDSGGVNGWEGVRTKGAGWARRA